MSVDDVIERHREAGEYFRTDGLRSFARSQGHGETVLCFHGVPASSFLYRKVIDELSNRGFRGVCFDLPGLGLADRPEDYDYTWSGLGEFSRKAVDALDLGDFHLVVHDIGGPVGFEVASEMPGRVKSLTLLNTMVRVDEFSRPWVMEPFAYRGVGELWLKSMAKPLFRQLMYWLGVEDRESVTTEELDAYVDLLKREDNGRAFLKIMRGFERTPEKSRRYSSAVRDVDYPVQVVWGEHDPALSLSEYGESVKEAAGLEEIRTVPAKHFLQEDQAPAVADCIEELAERSVIR